jgi:GDP-L-fucose synthase
VTSDAFLGNSSSFWISIKDLLETIARLTGFERRIVWDTSNVQRPLPRCKLDVSGAYQHFGFAAQTPFTPGLPQSIAWYIATTQSASGG